MKKIVFLSLLGLTASVFAEDQVVVNSATTPVVVEEEVASTIGQHGFYYALGLLLCNSGERFDFYDIDNERTTEANRFGTHLGATLALGYQFMPQSQPYCVGLEIGSDFAPRQEDHYSDKMMVRPDKRTDNYYDLTTTRNGFRPFVALRAGYVNYDHKFMVYAKAGMSYADSKARTKIWRLNSASTNYDLHAESLIKCSCWTPIVALGIEKSFTNNFTLRGEAEYKFTRTKDRGWDRAEGHTSAKFIQKGTFNVRVLFCHNIRIGQ